MIAAPGVIMRHATLCFVLICSSCASSDGARPGAEPQSAVTTNAEADPASTPKAWREYSLVASFREDDPELPPLGCVRAGRLPRVAPEVVCESLPAGLTLAKLEVENRRWDGDSGYWHLSFEAGTLQAVPPSTLLIRYVGRGGALEGCELASLPALSAKGLSMVGFRSWGPLGEIPLEGVTVQGVPPGTAFPAPPEEVSFAPDPRIKLVSHELEPVVEPSPGYRLVCVFENKGPDCDLLLACNWQWGPGSKSGTSGSDRAIPAFAAGSQRRLEFDAQSDSKVWRVRVAVKATRSPREAR